MGGLKTQIKSSSNILAQVTQVTEALLRRRLGSLKPIWAAEAVLGCCYKEQRLPRLPFLHCCPSELRGVLWDSLSPPKGEKALV